MTTLNYRDPVTGKFVEVVVGGGGASPDEVYVGPTEPTDPEVTVWINPAEQGGVDAYTKAEADARYVNADGDVIAGALKFGTNAQLAGGLGMLFAQTPDGTALARMAVAPPVDAVDATTKGYVDNENLKQFIPGGDGTAARAVDFNTVTAPGMHPVLASPASTNSPTNAYWYIVNFVFGGNITQQAWEYATGTTAPMVYARTKFGTVWTAWGKLSA